MLACGSCLANVQIDVSSVSPSTELHYQNPLDQYKAWIEQMKKIARYQRDTDLAVLGTVTENNSPDLRYLEIYPVKNGFVFYTSRQSVKAEEIRHNQHVFFVKSFFDNDKMGCQQIQVAGIVDRVTPFTTLHIQKGKNDTLIINWDAYHIKPTFFQFAYGRMRVNNSRVFERVSYNWVNGHWVRNKSNYYGFKAESPNNS